MIRITNNASKSLIRFKVKTSNLFKNLCLIRVFGNFFLNSRYSVIFKIAFLRGDSSYRFKNLRTSLKKKIDLSKFQLLNLIKNNFLIYFFFNFNAFFSFFTHYHFLKTNFNFTFLRIKLLNGYLRTFGDGFIYLRGLFLIFFVDACITDDEPLWEPIE